MGLLDIFANLCGIDKKPNSSLEKRIFRDSQRPPSTESQEPETPIYRLDDYRTRTQKRHDPDTFALIYAYIRKPLQHLDDVYDLDTLQARVEETHQRTTTVSQDQNVKYVISGNEYIHIAETLAATRKTSSWRTGVHTLQILDAHLKRNCALTIGLHILDESQHNYDEETLQTKGEEYLRHWKPHIR